MQLRSYTSTNNSHAHDHVQWVLPILGNLEIEIGKQPGIIDCNQGAFILPQTTHCFAS